MKVLSWSTCALDWMVALWVVVVLVVVARNAPQREAEAIERGFALYHPQTGEFTWREDSR